jgi:hypothetical protein
VLRVKEGRGRTVHRLLANLVPEANIVWYQVLIVFLVELDSMEQMRGRQVVPSVLRVSTQI